MPPLALTGERTLPDVPEENYWYRRHLVVYEWIAARVRGARVIDMACGEGYGSDVLARAAASVVGVEANPEAFEHARLRYPRVRFERALVEEFSEPADAVVFLQTIEHLQDPGATLDHFRTLVGEQGTVFLSTPNVLTLAPKGAERSDNPWHVHEYRPEEFAALCRRALLAGRDARALPRAQAAHCTSSRCGSAGTALTPRSASHAASTTGSRRRSTSATSRCGPPRRPICGARST